jgi:hypothetical protein
MDSMDLNSVPIPAEHRETRHREKKIRKTTELYWIEINGPTPVDGGRSG